MEIKDTMIYYKAYAIAFKLNKIDIFLHLAPDDIIKKASVLEICFYYERLCV